MLDVDFYRLYNGDCDLMPCFCRDFYDFYKSLPCFFAIFCRDFLLSLIMLPSPLKNIGVSHEQFQSGLLLGGAADNFCLNGALQMLDLINSLRIVVL